jgi:hypothetical protein
MFVLITIDRGVANQLPTFQQSNARFDAKGKRTFASLWEIVDVYHRPTTAARALCGIRQQQRSHTMPRRYKLNQIFRWIGIKSADDGSGAPRNPQETTCIFWINGSPGTGKTAIAYTVAEECKKRGILGASFFCSHDDTECSDSGLIFTTIAYQLGIFSPQFKAEVSRVMVSRPDIRYASISYQLELLIVNPLRSLAGSIRPCVVVIDALDECRDNGTQSVILSSLARYVSELSPIKSWSPVARNIILRGPPDIGD